MEPDNLVSQEEVTYAYANYGVLLYKQNYFESAYEHHLRALPAYKKIAKARPKDNKVQNYLANGYGWLATTSVRIEGLRVAYEYRASQIKILESLILKEPDNFDFQYDLLTAQLGISNIEIDLGKLHAAEQRISRSILISKALAKHDPINRRWFLNYGHFELLRLKINLILHNQTPSEKEINAISKICDDLDSKSGSMNSTSLKELKYRLYNIQSLAFILMADPQRAEEVIKSAYKNIEPADEKSKIIWAYVRELQWLNFVINETDDIFAELSSDKSDIAFIHPREAALYARALALSNQTQKSDEYKDAAVLKNYAFKDEYTALLAHIPIKKTD